MRILHQGGQDFNLWTRLMGCRQCPGCWNSLLGNLAAWPRTSFLNKGEPSWRNPSVSDGGCCESLMQDQHIEQQDKIKAFISKACSFLVGGLARLTEETKEEQAVREMYSQDAHKGISWAISWGGLSLPWSDLMIRKPGISGDWWSLL